MLSRSLGQRIKIERVERPLPAVLAPTTFVATRRRLLMYRFAFLTLVLVGACFATPASAQNRAHRLFQIQLDLGPMFAATAARAEHSGDYNVIESRTWVPGIQAGVHINRFVYVGLSYRPSNRMVRQQDWGFDDELDAKAHIPYRIGPTQSLDLRISPTRYGFFVSAGAALVSSAEFSFSARPAVGFTIQIDGEPSPGLAGSWLAPAYRSATVGLGYTYVHRRGPSLTVGLRRLFQERPTYVRHLDCCYNWEPARVVHVAEGFANADLHSRYIFYVSLGVNLVIYR